MIISYSLGGSNEVESFTIAKTSMFLSPWLLYAICRVNHHVANFSWEKLKSFHFLCYLNVFTETLFYYKLYLLFPSSLSSYSENPYLSMAFPKQHNAYFYAEIELPIFVYDVPSYLILPWRRRAEKSGITLHTFLACLMVGCMHLWDSTQIY